MRLKSGVRLGPYEVVGPLGKGGMGEVYRARDSRLGREVAVKILPDETATSPDALARFEREARAVAALNHPNILALHDVGAEPGVAFAVTELLEGETLRERLVREGAIPARRALDVAVQLARGLAAAHDRGIVHRDLKPENIFLTSDGRVKVLDFGLALQDARRIDVTTTETALVTEAGIIVGTVGYLSPEQVRSETASPRSDIFAFGVVVFEMLTGGNPFQRPTPAETLAAVLHHDVEPLAVPGVPAAAARLIDRCLERRPEDRPESMRDLAFYLEAVGSGSTLPMRASEDVDLRRPLAAAVAAVCGAILFVTLAGWWLVRTTADTAANAAIAADLERAEGLVLRAHQERLDRLLLTARLVASFPELKALFDTDAATIRDFLQTYQQRNPGTPLLMALSAEGFVLARTDGGSAGGENGGEWLARLARGGGVDVIAVDGRPVHAAASPAEAGGTVFGYVLAAAPVDAAFAQLLREATEDDAVLLEEGGVAGTTLRGGRAPWETLDAWRAARGDHDVVPSLLVGSSHFGAREVRLVADPPLSAVILKSRDEVTAPYRSLQGRLLALGAVVLLLAVGGGLAAFRRFAAGAHP